MQHTHIVLTQTFINIEKLKVSILNEWQKTQDLEKVLKNLDGLDFKDTEIHSKKSYLQMPFGGDDDHRMKIVRPFLDKIYIKYNEPTILFFQDLNIYDEDVHQKLLKILEEPPQNLIIILFARSLKEILPTIQSRANIINLKKETVFKLLKLDEIEKIKEKIGDVGAFLKDWLVDKNTLAFFEKIDFKKLEREEIDLWFWMVLNYLEKAIEGQTEVKNIKKTGEKVLKITTAMEYNGANVQKKFVFFNLL